MFAEFIRKIDEFEFFNDVEPGRVRVDSGGAGVDAGDTLTGEIAPSGDEDGTTFLAVEGTRLAFT